MTIPVLNEAAHIVAMLQALGPPRERGAEIVVVDGGSADQTIALGTPLADRVIMSGRGRAVQMNAGAAVARGDVLLFLHADTRLPADANQIILNGLAKFGRAWGRFDVTTEARHPLLPIVAAAMNGRCSLTVMTAGDHAMFLMAAAFNPAGSF